MSTFNVTASQAVSAMEQSAARAQRRHRALITLLSLLCTALLAAVVVRGFRYYLLAPAERPFSELHRLLRPGGTIGIRLGILGAAMFALIFLYPLRKRIPWLARMGKPQHWLDYHIVLGLTAPVLIALHASFKFHGIAGMAFWLMLAVALSGIAGRYLFAQVPRSINSAELSIREVQSQEEVVTSALSTQERLPPALLAAALHMPSAEQVQHMSLAWAFAQMIWLDLSRPWHIARLRRSALGGAELFFSLGGLLAFGDRELEDIVRLARRKASLAKRILFLGRAQQTLHLWHVVHRPFSYSFLVLAVAHIAIALGLGFM